MAFPLRPQLLQPLQLHRAERNLKILCQLPLRDRLPFMDALPGF